MTTGSCECRAAASGFTLVETLLVLAVVMLLGALLLPGVNSLLRTVGGEDPDRTVWDAITAAREQALTTNRTVWLRFDPKRRLLTWGEASGEQHRVLPVDASLRFLQPQEGNFIMVGGVLIDTLEVPAVRFYADGTCDRFRMQLRQGANPPQIAVVDPWTCAPILPPGK